MPETRLRNSLSTETAQTAYLCSRLSGPQGKGTAWRGTKASRLGVPSHGLRTSATSCQARPQQASLSASEDGDAQAHRARSGG